MNFLQNLYYNATHSGIGIFLGWWVIACMIAIPLILVYGRKIFLTRDETVMRCILIPIFCAIGALLISTTFIEYPANGKALWVEEKDGEWRRYDRPVLHAPFSWTGWDESSREITVEAPNSFNYGKLPVRRGLTVTVKNDPEHQKLFFENLGSSYSHFHAYKERNFGNLNRKKLENYLLETLSKMSPEEVSDEVRRDEILNREFKKLGLIVVRSDII